MKTLKLLSVLMVLAFLVGACAPAAAPTPAPAAPTAAPTVAPAAPTEAPTAAPTKAPAPAAWDSSKCLKVAVTDPAGEGNSLDPINIVAYEQEILVAQPYNRLLDLDPNFQLKLELAEKYEANADATEWTFHLRKGVKFHNGKEMTSKDVVYTYQRLLDPTLGSEAVATLAFLKPENIVAVDDYTVKFIVDKPVAELPLMITTKNTRIVPEGTVKDKQKFEGIGTGPWIPVDFKPTEQPHKFIKNPNYWEPGLPKMECVEFYLIPEATSRNAAIQSGQVDMISQADFSTIPLLEKDPNLKLFSTTAASSITLSMWVDTPPFDKLQVRQALKKVIDREAMLQTALLGYGELGDDNPIPPASPFAWRPAPAPRDVEGAKALLAEVGYGPSNPLKVDFYTADVWAGFMQIAQLFKEQAAEAGIEVNVIVGPPGEYWDNVWLKQPFVNSTWQIRPPGEGLALVYRQDSHYKETHWERPDYDAILDAATIEPDEAKRIELYRKAMKMLTEEGGVIIPVFVHTVSAMRTNCTGFEPHPQASHFITMGVECTR